MNINGKIANLWTQNLDKRVPMFYPTSIPCDIVFVGLNPSFSPKGFKKYLQNSPFKAILNNIKKYFKYTPKGLRKKIPQILKIEKLAVSKYRYFKSFDTIQNELNAKFCSPQKKPLKTKHIDLLLVRETNQKHIERMVKHNPAYRIFIEAQIELVTEYIISHKPKLVVICNAYACRLFQEKFSKMLKSMPSIGAEEFTWSKHKTIVLYSGMLSGQRALDTGSFDRLVWHIKYILKTHLMLQPCPGVKSIIKKI